MSSNSDIIFSAIDDSLKNCVPAKQDNKTHRMSRRETLKWLSAVSATLTIPLTTPALAAERNIAKSDLVGSFAPWPKLDIKPVEAEGYGKDPKLVRPDTSPWPLTLTSEEKTKLIRLSDILIPESENFPSDSAIGVPEMIDEWVSAPYPRQQRDRSFLIAGLEWLDYEAKRRFDDSFANCSENQQMEIVDDIAYSSEGTPPDLDTPTRFFAALRQLVAGIYYCTPEGTNDLGYIGNVPIVGDYPGPTAEALDHLNKLLDELGLTL
jgi:hypothetical protein